MVDSPALSPPSPDVPGALTETLCRWAPLTLPRFCGCSGFFQSPLSPGPSHTCSPLCGASALVPSFLLLLLQIPAVVPSSEKLSTSSSPTPRCSVSQPTPLSLKVPPKFLFYMGWSLGEARVDFGRIPRGLAFLLGMLCVSDFCLLSFGCFAKRLRAKGISITTLQSRSLSCQLGCCNSIAQIRGYVQQKLTSHGSGGWESESRVPAWAGSGGAGL